MLKCIKPIIKVNKSFIDKVVYKTFTNWKSHSTNFYQRASWRAALLTTLRVITVFKLYKYFFQTKKNIIINNLRRNFKNFFVYYM